MLQSSDVFELSGKSKIVDTMRVCYRIHRQIYTEHRNAIFRDTYGDNIHDGITSIPQRQPTSIRLYKIDTF